jgi:hypothetical protein
MPNIRWISLLPLLAASGRLQLEFSFHVRIFCTLFGLLPEGNLTVNRYLSLSLFEMKVTVALSNVSNNGSPPFFHVLPNFRSCGETPVICHHY